MGAPKQLPKEERVRNEILGQLALYPLEYVMWVFPWENDKSIQLVPLEDKYAQQIEDFSGVRYEYGPDSWACQFLNELGEEIRARRFRVDSGEAVEPIRFSTASGHGIGKSTMVAWIIKFILDTRPMAKGVVTANTSDQLRTKTWAQVAYWNAKSRTADRWIYRSSRGNMSLSFNSPREDIRENWRCDAMTCREENAEAFQGLHCATSTPFYIFDEASGIPDKIWESRSGGATDGEPMWFDFGNPTRKSGFFFENTIGKFRHRFKTRSIDSRSCFLTNKSLMQEWVDDWGEDSDFVKVKVRGMFPSAGSVQFMNSDEVLDAMNRTPAACHTAPLVLGVDVARFGDNSTIIYPRIGMDAQSNGYREYKGLDIVQVVEKVIETIKYFASFNKPCRGLFVDGGGLGGGVVDMLRRLGYNPVDVNFGGKASDQKYRYRGDEMYGRLRDAMPRLSLVNNQDLFSQLTQREYGFGLSGKLSLESKKDMVERGLQSPDVSDGLALTFAAEVGEAIQGLNLHTYHQVFTEYDPLEWKE